MPSGSFTSVLLLLPLHPTRGHRVVCIESIGPARWKVRAERGSSPSTGPVELENSRWGVRCLSGEKNILKAKIPLWLSSQLLLRGARLASNEREGLRQGYKIAAREFPEAGSIGATSLTPFLIS